MAGGFDVNTGGLDAIASTLRTASTNLDGTEAPPPAPEAGAVTGAINAMLGVLTSGAASVVESVGAAGDAVADGGAAYTETEANETQSFSGTQVE